MPHTQTSLHFSSANFPCPPRDTAPTHDFQHPGFCHPLPLTLIPFITHLGRIWLQLCVETKGEEKSRKERSSQRR